MFTICIRHRLLGWVPGNRWHIHLSKPAQTLGSGDFDVIDEIRDQRWWVVTELGTSRSADS